MNTAIIIPSRDRVEVLSSKSRHTLTYAKHSKHPVYVVVRESEFAAYEELAKAFAANVLTVPEHVDRIAKTYDYVMAMTGPAVKKLLFMDDDLIFAERRDFSSPKLTNVVPERFDEIADALFAALDEPRVAMAGIAHRRGAQTHTVPKRYNQKLIAVLACNVESLRGKKWEWGYDSMFDHNMVLECLVEGWRNVQISSFTHDDILPRHAKGGCTEYRSMDVHSNAAIALAKKYPDIVTLRDKWVESANRYGLDVTMHMKKAFGDGTE